MKKQHRRNVLRGRFIRKKIRKEIAEHGIRPLGVRAGLRMSSKKIK